MLNLNLVLWQEHVKAGPSALANLTLSKKQGPVSTQSQGQHTFTHLGSSESPNPPEYHGEIV